MTTNPEPTPEELIKLREEKAQKSLELWASLSAQDLRKKVDLTLFNYNAKEN